VKYAFIRQHRERYSLQALSHVLHVSRSGYYDWLGRAPCKRTQANNELLEHIRTAHTKHRRAYGAFKTWCYLQSQGIACGKHRVARLRKEAGIEAQRKRRFRLTVEHHHTPKAAPDLLQRQFSANAPNLAWVGDMTFIRTRQGWLHLVVLLDLFSRKVVGWAMGERATTVLHRAALAMAISQRRPEAGLVHHTDRGAVYSAPAYRELLAEAGMQPSMNGRKTAYDNAVAESFFSNLKNEWVHHHDFKTREDAKLAIFDYIECFYNRNRIHQSLGYRTPDEVERLYYGA
jgi:transposase InsO family protein